ncbi:hypothetical protein AOL_s00140g68 [Orbilia oligospora ATCC 24927]|uniref:Uncharacterized protein n=2 Tax=Orbilia oligospora TaxID=2813651 RepID=G1XM99_ARTOA|nr:hypothetical protein AOL_s00140g68 [Orbilia oligospora ATCC 24927]EGX45752.1 hypothetical protein AOL_s00140g68 [Orbilia oligospora ATCC 24927]KAF3272362.1 hypothetical protein TWF970_010085 [Orbilia oligospora]
MSRSSGTGFLHPRSFTIFFYIFFISTFYSRTVPAAPILQDIHNDRRDTNISVECTKSTSLSTESISIITNIKTIIETTFTTQTDVVTRTIIDGVIDGSSSSISTSTGLPAETTSTLTTVQSGSPVVSDIGTEPGYVFSTPEYTTSSSSSSLYRPTITMIASPPVAVVPTNEPEKKPVPSSEVLIITTSIEPSISSATALPVSTTSTELTSTESTSTESTTSIELTTIPSFTSTSIITTLSSTTALSPEEPTSMASNIIIPIETPQPSLDSETTSSLQNPPPIATYKPSPSLTTTFHTVSTSSISSSQSSIDPPKTGYILTGIILPQPSDIPAAQSTRVQLDGGVSMPTITSGVDLNGPPELVFRGDAGRGVSISIGVWGISGVAAVVLGMIV